MQLFQIFLTSYGILGLILSLVALLLFVVQVVIYVRLGMMVGYKNNRRKKVREDEPAVSIVVSMFSEDYGFVEERLPLMLKQEYREFEVV
ncbi:MAG: glycosyltransferase, partial [Alistipes sp.]|nr:glycosyltransferase [Alistipes sp.]